MPEMRERYQREQIIAHALAALYGQQRARLIQYLGQVPSIDAIPEWEWKRIEHETNEALRAELLLVYLLAATNLRINPAVLPQQQIARKGLEFADRRAASIASQMTANTRASVQEILLRHAPVPDWRHVAIDHQGAFHRELIDVFGPRRATAAAITETTGAITTAERESIQAAGENTGEGAEHVERTLIWRILDNSACIHCKPLNRRRMDEWENFTSGYYLEQIIANGGPPAHPNCRCYTEFVIPEHWRWN